jgi:hypothetical protein
MAMKNTSGKFADLFMPKCRPKSLIKSSILTPTIPIHTQQKGKSNDHNIDDNDDDEDDDDNDIFVVNDHGVDDHDDDNNDNDDDNVILFQSMAKKLEKL